MWVGRELEQLGVAWFEEPLLCEDIPGHARLAAALDIPIAMGETLGSRFEFDAYLRAGAVDICSRISSGSAALPKWSKW